MASRRWPRPVLTVLAALAVALTVAGCVSLPSAGPVQSYPVTQGTDAQAQNYVQIVSGPPQPGWKPQQIVEGFLTASASFTDNEQVAREYLTQQAIEQWNPFTSPVVVYKDGPNPSTVAYLPAPTRKPAAKASGAPKGKAATQPETATVTIHGVVQANLYRTGSYVVGSGNAEPSALPTFQLVMVDGQWRISTVPPQLLLTADSFANDYELRNLYFFDPLFKYLVPDPVYVPFQATSADLMDGLVDYLIAQPHDWLSDGTKTAFPAGTKRIGDVSLAGPTAVVNLGGAIVGASRSVMEQVSAQLCWTLSGAGQGGQAVQSIEVLTNGKPYIPLGSQGNPVQAQCNNSPPTGASTNGTFYYLGAGNMLYSQSGVHGNAVAMGRMGPSGANFDQIAVSPDGKYLAAVTVGDELYTGSVNGPLTKQNGSGYTSVSWDPDDDLWATMGTNQQVVVLLPGNHLVSVTGPDGPLDDVTALAVAPDGIRVALIENGDSLNFGAISWNQGTRPGQLPSVQISPSPFSVQDDVSFETVTWYGPDNVITLATGQTLSATEYPVNGGGSTQIPTVPGMSSISASSGSALIAGLSDGYLLADASLTGSWAAIGSASISPVYPG